MCNWIVKYNFSWENENVFLTLSLSSQISNVLNISNIWHEICWNNKMETGASDCGNNWYNSSQHSNNNTIESLAGTQNYSGLSVFSAVPVGGSIAPGQSQDITVTFQPDHPSVYYSDTLTIELVNKVSRAHTLTHAFIAFLYSPTPWPRSHGPGKTVLYLHPVCPLFNTALFLSQTEVCVMDLKGAASSHNMYLYGGDQLTVPIESLLPPLITSLTQPTGSEASVSLSSSFTTNVMEIITSVWNSIVLHRLELTLDSASECFP